MSTILTLAQAWERVAGRAIRRPVIEQVALGASLGRRLARDFDADGPWPSTDRSAMDGFAVAAGAAGLEAGAELRVTGESLAGRPFAERVAAGAAIRIMTGAVVPDGVDAVVPVESTTGFAGATVTLRASVRRGDHIRRRGSEVATGERLLGAGCAIGSAEIGALAVLGAAVVPVFRQPRVAILATGDEVVPVEQVPEPHQVRDSNSHALAAQVVEGGGEPRSLGRAPDRREALRELLERGLRESDLLLTIGGVSQGTHDLVHGCLRELGVEGVFHGIALKPGKPTFFGEQRGAALVFGLPGNPASCCTVFDLLVRPLLARLAGAADGVVSELEVALGGEPCGRNRRLQAVPARLRAAPGGRGATLVAELCAVRPSGDPFSLLDSDGYALIPADTDPATLPTVPFRPRGGRWPGQ